MTVTPELIDHVLSVVINNSGISTPRIAMMVSVDQLEVFEALMWLWEKHEIERKTEHGVVCWYDPEQPR